MLPVHTTYSVTYNYSTNFVVQKYKFHLIGPDQFEELAATVLMEIYKVPFSIFKKGKDGGQDAVAMRVNIDLGGGNILTNQNVIVQVKHTTNASAKLTDGTRKSDKLKKVFKDAGTKEVVVVGYETLSLWLNSSLELKNKVRRLYPAVVHTTDLSNSARAVRSVQLLEVYKEDLKNTIHVKAFTKANEIMESAKGLVFITGVAGSGKTTVAKQLVVHLSQEYDFFDIINPDYFAENWIPNQKQVFFMDNIDSDDMNKWCKFEDKLKVAIEKGSKFVFASKSIVLEEARCALNKPGHHVFYDRLYNAAINLSDEQFNLSKNKKQEMLKKHVEMGDNDSSTREALLKDDMVSHAAEINCPCFPLVAKSLGSRDRLKQFNAVVPTVYNQEFLNQFFKWIQSRCESPAPKCPRHESEPRSTADNITGSTSESCESPAPKRPRLQSEPRSTVDNEYNITGL